MEINQTTFSGGSNLFDIDTAIAADQYRMLINGRSRFGEILPIPKSAIQSTLPAGLKQGGTGVGNVAVAFVAGKAYYQIDGQSAWLNIANFSMDPIAPRLYTVTVAKSTQDYIRKRGDTMNSPIKLSTDFSVSGNPAGILVQDGLNQAWFIQFNAVSQTFVARVTKTFAQWANTSTSGNDREYVPIGKQMFTMNQKLYIVASDGKSIYQSITGRPLDFMVNIDVNGNKLASEALGGAASVSFTFDSDVITCVKEVNIPDSFAYGTAKHTRIITLDYTNTILGEPTYRRAIDVSAGIVNDQCFLEILGDYTFIDDDGVKSFNAVQSTYVEGRNGIFSLYVSKLFKDRKQTSCAAINYNNYALFYCQTTLGNAILVYDQLRKIWTSFDVTQVTKIKQFFTVETGLQTKLYAVTPTDVWLMYSSDASEVCQVYMGAILPTNPKLEHKGQYIEPIFRGCTVDGTKRIIEYVDEQKSAELKTPMYKSTMAMTFPISFPIGFDNIPNMINDVAIFKDGSVGKKIAYVIIWDTDAALRGVNIKTTEQSGMAASNQYTKRSNTYVAPPPAEIET